MKYVILLLAVLLAVGCGSKKNTHPPSDADTVGTGDSDLLEGDADVLIEDADEAVPEEMTDAVTDDGHPDLDNAPDKDADNDIAVDTDEVTDTEFPDETVDEALPDEVTDTFVPDEAEDETLPDEESLVVPDETSDTSVPDEIADETLPDESADETPDDDGVLPPPTGSNGLIFVSGGAVAEGNSTRATISLGGVTPLGTAEGANFSLRLGVTVSP